MSDFPFDLEWLGHASFRINSPVVIYIDPYKIDTNKPADIILITHGHHDHYSEDDIQYIRTPETKVIAPADVAREMRGMVDMLKPGEATTVKIGMHDIVISAVPAYNRSKPFHAKSKGWVGYLITINGKTLYHTGDTDMIDEMDRIKCDVALVPVGGTYTMDAEEAAEMVNRMKPEYAVPMHYGKIVGDTTDADEFEKLCNVPVKRFDK